MVFTSDNGFSCGHHGIWGKGNATTPLNRATRAGPLLDHSRPVSP